MNITIENIGAVKKAQIDLNKKLTVFCGPNGTGKTYLAYLIYAITNISNKSIGEKIQENVANEIIANGKAILDFEIQDLWSFRQKEIATIKNNLFNLFAIPENKANQHFSKTEVSLDEEFDSFRLRVENMCFTKNLDVIGNKIIIEKIINSFSVQIIIEEKSIKNHDLLRFIEIALLSRIYSLIAFFPIVSSTIFPVERNSIFTFSDELSISTIHRYEMIKELSSNKEFDPIELFFKRNTRYPQPIRDALRVAEDLENIQKKNSPYFNFAVELEDELLNGRVSITNEGTVEFNSNKAKSVKLSFHQSSSIVKTLSSLIIYLKHIATKDDLVIIDEPELNLHPDNQIKLARIFARLVNKGLRLIISTHSDYIVRELNNLIMISVVRQTDRESRKIKELGYSDDEYIDINDFGAYLFKHKNLSSRKADVLPIEVTKDGFDVETLDNTIEELNSRSEELFYTIKYSEDE